MISYSGAQTPQDIEQILSLQQRNLSTAITSEELAREGFVTVAHTYDILWTMNQLHPHIVAKSDRKVVGYALVMLKQFRAEIPVLAGLFTNLDKLNYRGRRLAETPYFVMGQVCIDKAFRGQGLFGGLYQQMKTQMQTHFELIVTSVAKRNPRSLRAHQKTGFQIIDQFKDEWDEWDIVAWGWE